MVKDNKRLQDELPCQNTVIKLLIDDFKQLADSIGKSNTTVSLLQTFYNFILLKKYRHRVTIIQSISTNFLPNCHQLLEPTSENIKLVPGKIE